MAALRQVAREDPKLYSELTNDGAREPLDTDPEAMFLHDDETNPGVEDPVETPAHVIADFIVSDGQLEDGYECGSDGEIARSGQLDDPDAEFDGDDGSVQSSTADKKGKAPEVMGRGQRIKKPTMRSWEMVLESDDDAAKPGGSRRKRTRRAGKRAGQSSAAK